MVRRMLRFLVLPLAKLNCGRRPSSLQLSALLVLGSLIVGPGIADAQTTDQLKPSTVYYYRASSEAFQKRLKWIATTLPENHFTDYDKETAKLRKAGHGWLINTNEFMYDRLMFGGALVKKMNRSELERHLERHNRGLPKTSACKEWQLSEIESIPKDVLKSKEMKDLLDGLEKWNMSLQAKVGSVQKNVKIVGHYSAFVYRSTDEAILFVGGVHWTYPYHSDGYTELHLVISSKTGKVITEKLGFTNSFFEPKEFEQYKEILIPIATIATLFISKGK
jgi:hypothetical protein